MTMRIASYNIRKAMGLDRRRDPTRILGILNALGASVVALQEADRRLGPRPAALPRLLIEQETDYRVVDLAANDVSLGWHGNAILVHRDVEVLGTDRLHLPGLEPRGAVAARLALPGSAPLTVIGAHLGLLRTYRRQQLRHLRDWIDREQAGATLLMGDFNEWSDTTGLEPLDGALEMISPGRSFHAARPIASLDRIGLSPSLRLTDAGVDTSAPARIASDHLPIWAEIEQSASDRPAD
jgi:endonuclease/exonuclease/phosphatase family metal-dependent hydrolase